jgi:hypothetical protein
MRVFVTGGTGALSVPTVGPNTQIVSADQAIILGYAPRSEPWWNRKAPQSSAVFSS